jgi:hypothetical protein
VAPSADVCFPVLEISGIGMVAGCGGGGGCTASCCEICKGDGP